MDSKVTGEKIYNLRKARGWTQIELAEKLFVSDKAVSRWESGTGFPEIAQLPQIANIFGVTVDYLLSDENGRIVQNIHFVEESPKTEKQQVQKEEKKPVLIRKGFNISFLIIAVLMFISYFIRLNVSDVSIPFLNESISYSFSIADLLFYSSGYWVISLFFILATLYEIVSNIIVLSMPEVNKKKFALISKISSIINMGILTVLSLILVSQNALVYLVVLLIVSLIMLGLAIFNLVAQNKISKIAVNTFWGICYEIVMTVFLIGTFVAFLSSFQSDEYTFMEHLIRAIPSMLVIIIILPTIIFTFISLIKKSFKLASKLFIFLTNILFLIITITQIVGAFNHGLSVFYQAIILSVLVQGISLILFFVILKEKKEISDKV